MIRITQIKLPVSHTKEELRSKIAKTLHLREGTDFTYEIIRQSLDARRKKDKKYVYTVEVRAPGEKRILRSVSDNNIMHTKKEIYQFPLPGKQPLLHRPVIAGSGPAGLFCAYMLAKQGYAPVVLERGQTAGERQKSVESFWKGNPLHPDSNVQFGEGGAGTFSDGKLNTLVKDPAGRNREVLKILVEAGAPSQILYEQKPHLGTDLLVYLVENLRQQILDMGGSFFFQTQLTDLLAENGVLKGITLNREQQMDTQVLVAAVGHSARDTFEMLALRGIKMQQKPFAVGLRIEHPQEMVNLALYGEKESGQLGPASYKLTHKLACGRGVYSFCMCPGGWVVNASSEEKGLAVNGMSYQARDSANANSALVVTVRPEDFPSEDVLAGVAYQRRLEEAAFGLAAGRIPVQLFGDFCQKKESTVLGDVIPCTKGSCALSQVRSILPDYIGDAIEEGIFAFEKQIPGFSRPDALLSAIESRTSSPVRILRNQEMEANVSGFYPCGEGAGYAGGITSAAMDGLKTAEAIVKKYARFPG